MSSNHSSGMRRGPMGHGRGRGPAEKAKDFKGTMAKLIRYLGSYRINIIIAFLFSIVSVALMVIGPKILGNATTELTNGFMAKISGTGGIDFGKIETILLQLIGLYLISTLCGFIQSWMMAGVAQKVAYQLRAEMAHKVDFLPFSYFDSQSHGEVLSRFSNDVDMIQQTMNQSLGQLISSFVQIIGYLVMMLSISFTMTLLALIVVPLSLILVTTVVKHSQKYFAAQQSSLGEVNGHIEEMYGAHMIMKAFNGEEKSVAEFEKLNDQLYDSAWKSQFFSGMMQPIMAFVGNLGYAGVALSGGLLAINGVITIGDIQAFIQYVRNFTQPITQIAQVINQVQSMAAASERVFEFLNEEEEEQIVKNPVSTDNIRGEVEFDHVRFGYKEDQVIIRDFCAKVKPGQKVAIVGPTGAGKTTMVKLLMRFYDVNSGEIRIDGHNIKDFNRRELRDAFGMVLQDTWLYKDTIMENIRYGKLEASDEEVIAAAKAAHAHHFIETLPGGYNMELNEDASNVSQGQKQLLTIARAILADNKILILDEATSALDNESERHIQKSLEELAKNRTCITIAHRLSTIRDADTILFMDHGNIIEQGSHEELLKKNGAYAALYYSQFE